MKFLLASIAFATVPALALAQAGTPPAKPAPKTAAKPAPGANKKLAPSAQKAVEESTPIDTDPNVKLTEADLEVAKKVYVGEIPCELGATVKVSPMKREGFFLVAAGRNRFVMHPVDSRTGAIRLEDPARGAMWLQLGNKSMLMSQKLGQRLADECQSPQQLTYAEELKKNPLPSILDKPATPAESQTPPAAASSSPAGTPTR